MDGWMDVCFMPMSMPRLVLFYSSLILLCLHPEFFIQYPLVDLLGSVKERFPST